MSTPRSKALETNLMDYMRKEAQRVRDHVGYQNGSICISICMLSKSHMYYLSVLSDFAIM